MSQNNTQHWQSLVAQSQHLIHEEPLLAAWLKLVVSNKFSDGLAYILAQRLQTKRLKDKTWVSILEPLFRSDICIQPTAIDVSAKFQAVPINQAIVDDLTAAIERDPLAPTELSVSLFSKSYHALCCYRAMHCLWHQGRYALAHYLQSRVSKVFSIDIHPAAVMGSRITIGHGSGVVIGATAVVEDNVSMMQQVTLGGTGKQSEDRHPKIRQNVSIGAGSQILGNIEMGENAIIAPASVVLKSVPANTKVAGVPAKVVE